MLRMIGRYFRHGGSRFLLTYTVADSRTIGATTLANKAGNNPPDAKPETVDAETLAKDYVDRVIRLLPIETSVTFSAFSANLIADENDVFWNAFTFLSCVFVTAIVRLPLVTGPADMRQGWTYALNIAICALWVYSVGGYLINFGPQDDQFCWAIMFLLGIVLPLMKIGFPKSKVL